MINNWDYNSIGGKRDFVKSYIQEKGYKTIDVGASAMYWSYPECKFVADSLVISKEGTTFFNINLENKNTREDIYCMHHGIKLNEDLQCSKCLEQTNK